MTFAEANGLRSRTVALLYAGAWQRAAAQRHGVRADAGGARSVGGSVLVEGVYSYPGVGNLLYLAVINHDYPLMQALLLVLHAQHAGRDLRRRPALPAPRPASPECDMTIITSVPAAAGSGHCPPGADFGAASAGGTGPLLLHRAGAAHPVEQRQDADRPDHPRPDRPGEAHLRAADRAAIPAHGDQLRPAYKGPSATNLLGTTGNGQDVFSQLIFGARVSLIVGLCAGALATLVAVTIGLISGLPDRPDRRGAQLRPRTSALVIPAATADDHPGGLPARGRPRCGRSC